MNKEAFLYITKSFALFAVFSFTSCVSDKRIFQKQRFADFEQLKITTVIKLEKKGCSKDISPDHLIGIGEGIYPNKNKFILATPKTYKAKDRQNFVVETDYFYSINDSCVKVILYQWDKFRRCNSRLFKEEYFTKKFKVFQNKFDDIKDKLTIELGEPIEINIEQNKTSVERFRDGVKWRNNNGLNAYLFMFGNNNGYRQIRLAIYKD